APTMMVSGSLANGVPQASMPPLPALRTKSSPKLLVAMVMAILIAAPVSVGHRAGLLLSSLQVGSMLKLMTAGLTAWVVTHSMLCWTLVDVARPLASKARTATSDTVFATP